jgi:hypothetical protein
VGNSSRASRNAFCLEMAVPSSSKALLSISSLTAPGVDGPKRNFASFSSRRMRDRNSAGVTLDEYGASRMSEVWLRPVRGIPFTSQRDEQAVEASVHGEAGGITKAKRPSAR